MTSNQRASSPGVLAGIRVLDFTSFLAGPYCTRLMADVGAEVVKIEPPEGDPHRFGPPLRDGKSSYYGQLNCGKKSLSLDLKKPEATDLVLQLVRKSDVIVENFRPGVMKRLGLDYETLAGLKPDIVYCSISGYGQTGPSAGLPAYAPIIHAASGYDLAQLRYQQDQDRPARGRLTTADILGGSHALGAVTAALFHRERTARGQHIDIALMDVMHHLLCFEYQEAQFPMETLLPYYGPMKTRDGFVVVVPLSQKNFENLATAIGHPEWISDPCFLTVAKRLANWELLMRAIEEWTAAHTSLQCEETISAAGCPCSRYMTVAESMARPQVSARGAAVEVDDRAGSFKVPNCPIQYSSADAGARRWVAELGQHNEELLSELLFLSADDIAELSRTGVLRGP